MRTRSAMLALVVLVTSIAAVLDLAVAADSAADRPTTTLAPWPAEATGAAPDATAEAVAQVEAEAAWYAGVAAEEARVAAERAAAAAAAARPGPAANGPAYHPGTTDGECTGFAIPDWIIRRESGGNPSAYNQSGAYGCAQTLLTHYQDGRTCGGLDPFTIEGQRECVWRLSNGGTNLQPWAMG